MFLYGTEFIMIKFGHSNLFQLDQFLVTLRSRLIESRIDILQIHFSMDLLTDVLLTKLFLVDGPVNEILEWD